MSWRGFGFRVFLATSAVFLAAVAVAAALGVNKGFELTDEGLYLLAADPPSPTASWGFPFGWHTRPLFALANYDIAAFRVLGALMLLLATTWFTNAVFRALASDVHAKPNWPTSVAIAVGGISSLLYYVPMLRTPSYNWLNLVGITVASAAALTVVSSPLESMRGLSGYPLPLLASFGMFLSFPGKPSTLPAMWALTGLLIFTVHGARYAAQWLLRVSILLPAWLIVALAFGVWPREFSSVFRLAMAMPAPYPLQTPAAAIVDALQVPQSFASGLASSPQAAFLLLAVSLLSLILSGRLNAWRKAAAAVLGLSGACVSGLMISGVPVPILNPGGHWYSLAYAPLVTGGLVVLLATAVLALVRRAPSRPSDALPRAGRTAWVLAFLSTLPFVYAFGSGNGIYAQGSGAMGLILIAALGITWAAGDTHASRLRWVERSILLGTVLLFVAFGLVSGWRAPYRMAPLLEQNLDTRVGVHGARLQLSTEMGEEVAALQAAALVQGWQAGLPLTDVSYAWNPGIAYALGARTPDSLMLTIFGNPGTIAISKFHLSEPFRDFDFDQSWLLTTARNELDQGQQEQAAEVLSGFAEVSGRPFPSAYACQRVGSFVVWRPQESGISERGMCAG